MALHALGKNKVQTALTMLGIVIGVSAVIAMVSLGQGAQKLVQNQVAGMGQNVLQVDLLLVSVGHELRMFLFAHLPFEDREVVTRQRCLRDSRRSERCLEHLVGGDNPSHRFRKRRGRRDLSFPHLLGPV